MKPDYVKALLDAGAKVDMQTGTATGAATVAGPSTTTTTNNSSGTTTNTQNTTYNITYNGNQVSYSTSNVINTTNPDGTTATQTITADKDKTPDECEKYPDSAGCSKLGDVPTPDKLKNTPYAVSVVATAFAGGACPAPLAFTVVGQSYSVSYASLCERLALLKWLFVAIAGVISAYILADSFKV